MRTREDARIVIAYANKCVVCQNTRDSAGDANGLTEEFYDYATQWRTWPGYSDAERIAMEFADPSATDHTTLRDDEDFWERAGAHFTHEFLTDLAISCAM